MELRTPRVLIVEDEAILAQALEQFLASRAFAVDLAYDADEAMKKLARERYDVAIVDVYLGERSGFEVLAFAIALEEPPAALMTSGRADVSAVVEAMRLGASDFVEKPIDNEVLFTRLERLFAIARRRTPGVPERERERERRSVAPPPMSSSHMREALKLADKVAATPNSSALIVGESGVGKEVIAARIHEMSSRRDGPYIRVNLAAISESLLESELFGSVKGAFTDSKSNRAGYFVTASGGTILLDEIGEFHVSKQAKLLRVLEERRFFPVGSDKERSTDVRVLAATNRAPSAMLASGLLRPDLFYRLGTVINIPPLRERQDEILPLARHFIETFCAELGKPLCTLSPTATTLLQKYLWPGNVRQLRNAIERAVMLAETTEMDVDAFDLPSVGSPPGAGGRKGHTGHRLYDVRERALEDVERRQIALALERANGSRAKAARLLGLSRSTLYEKLKRYNLA